MHKLSKARKYDPFSSQQEIDEFNIAIHCCRYLMLSEWNCEDMSFPFWRLYHSRKGGAFIYHNNNCIEISADYVVVIPPYTSFSTQLNPLNTEEENINGIKIQTESEIEMYYEKGFTDQLFIHFNLGTLYDNQEPGIFSFTIDNLSHTLLNKIEKERINNPDKIDYNAIIKINQLIFTYLNQFPFEQDIKIDQRISKVTKYIDDHIDKRITYEILSRQVNMARNSFARLFKESIGTTVNKFILAKRVEKSIHLLHHTNLSIEEISELCGFYDRNHFSKIFISTKGQSPVQYKKKYNL